MGRDINQGKIHQIFGSVVDIKFEENNIPSIYEALEAPVTKDEKLVFEVQEQLPGNIVRCIAMGSTDGLQRGIPVNRTHSPIKVPVGNECLGRIFNVLGQPIDGGKPITR